jgi:DNA helicase-2/ATP-dependent DNA helicase PcrA
VTRAETASGLTLEQLTAAGTPRRRLYIEAAPGSGKTTVAAQRFGIQRFHGNDQRAVIAVSFTRSATAELRDRVLSQWGPDALAWPHRIVTLDTIVCDLLTHLLHTGHVRWPAGHRDLTVIDHWRVLLSTQWTDREPTVALETGQVVTQVVRRAGKANRPSTVDVGEALAEGYCTHQDARHLLESALGAHGVRDVLLARLAQTARALIVNEIFDANALDLSLVRLAADAGLEVTVVGDPWQALYGFRGARPEQVPCLVQDARFVQRDLRTSFRWKSVQQALLADQLRAGQGVTLLEGQAENMDVLLALRWKSLWEAGPQVLPLAYGSTTGHIHEAACTLLLSEVTQRMFGENATFHSDALTTLGIDHEAAQRLRSPLQTIAADLADTTGIAEIWTSLNTVVASETNRPLPRRRNYTHTARLENLRARLHTSASRIIPGLTAHQAKGREWDAVGVCLTGPEHETLRQGLSSDSEEHRKLYVALTRAKRMTTAVSGDVQ